METKGGFLISRIKQVGGRLFDRMLAEADIDACAEALREHHDTRMPML